MSWCEPKRLHYPSLTVEKQRLLARGIDVERSTDEFLAAILTRPISKESMGRLSALMHGPPVRRRGRAAA